ncbi:N-acetyl-beta-D-galactosaminidase [Aureococcus anophagefferens]|uniref:N-acetyl-beta-D-galactosaminidase n=1 Tax=Aureococcus anophagefferens TaxID=44056 RepID=A0ABR1FSQ1_AURAN
MVAEGGYADVSSMDAVIRDLESRYDRLQGLRQHPGTDVAKEKLLAQIGMVDPVDASASRDERRRLKKRLLRELDGEKDHLRKTLDVVEAARRPRAAPTGARGPARVAARVRVREPRPVGAARGDAEAPGLRRPGAAAPLELGRASLEGTVVLTQDSVRARARFANNATSFLATPNMRPATAEATVHTREPRSPEAVDDLLARARAPSRTGTGRVRRRRGRVAAPREPSLAGYGNGGYFLTDVLRECYALREKIRSDPVLAGDDGRPEEPPSPPKSRDHSPVGRLDARPGRRRNRRRRRPSPPSSVSDHLLKTTASSSVKNVGRRESRHRHAVNNWFSASHAYKADAREIGQADASETIRDGDGRGFLQTTESAGRDVHSRERMESMITRENANWFSPSSKTKAAHGDAPPSPDRSPESRSRPRSAPAGARSPADDDQGSGASPGRSRPPPPLRFFAARRPAAAAGGRAPARGAAPSAATRRVRVAAPSGARDDDARARAPQTQKFGRSSPFARAPRPSRLDPSYDGPWRLGEIGWFRIPEDKKAPKDAEPRFLRVRVSSVHLRDRDSGGGIGSLTLAALRGGKVDIPREYLRGNQSVPFDASPDAVSRRPPGAPPLLQKARSAPHLSPGNGEAGAPLANVGQGYVKIAKPLNEDARKRGRKSSAPQAIASEILRRGGRISEVLRVTAEAYERREQRANAAKTMQRNLRILCGVPKKGDRMTLGDAILRYRLHVRHDVSHTIEEEDEEEEASAATRMQAIMRARRDREAVKGRHAAAAKLQRLQRKRSFRRKRRGSEFRRDAELRGRGADFVSHDRDDALHLDSPFPNQETAARALQARLRGDRARKDRRREHAGASRLQARARPRPVAAAASRTRILRDFAPGPASRFADADAARVLQRPRRPSRRKRGGAAARDEQNRDHAAKVLFYEEELKAAAWRAAQQRELEATRDRAAFETPYAEPPSANSAAYTPAFEPEGTPAAGPAPAPDDWEELFDDAEGRAYYWSKARDESRWDKPACLVTLYSDWEKHFDAASQHYYYYSESRGESTWDAPEPTRRPGGATPTPRKWTPAKSARPTPSRRLP